MHLIINLIEQYGLIAVFASVLLEGLGLPLPSYPILMVAAALTPTHNYQASEIIFTGVIASMFADILWFGAGRRFGTRIVGLLCKISLSPDSCVRSTGMMFARIGTPYLSLTKFIPGFATIAIVLTGAAKSSVKSFLFYDVIGEFLYISGGVLLGVLFRGAIDSTLAVLSKWGHWGLITLGAAMGLFLLAKWAQRQQLLRQLRMNRITVSDLNRLIEDGQNPVILDVRSPQSRAMQGSIPGSVFANILDLAPIVKQFPTTTEIVVYCSCPNEVSAATVAKRLKKAGFKKIHPLLGGIEAWTKAGYAIEPAIAQDETAPAIRIAA